MTRVLLVEDDASIRSKLALLLRQQGYEVDALGRAEDVTPLLAEGAKPDLLLLDVRLEGMSGIDLVHQLVDAGELLPTIIISGEASITETVEALKLGVYDFIEKPFSHERLLHSIQNALSHCALADEVAMLRSASTGQLLGESDAMTALREDLSKAAATEARVLVCGESGTGKELVANELHRHSRRRLGPFIKINCAAIPASLIEDELFGHARGSFTDARTAKAGLFEEAHRGTLFLDEIGDMELELQAKLLRVLEDGRVRRIGETRARSVDVRVIAATNQDLEQARASRRFRDDLYFRLAHLVLTVPPLRQRRSDIPLLVTAFLDLYSHRHRMRRRTIERSALAQLERYPWPGNVRELKSVCERLVVFAGNPITVDQLDPSITAQAVEGTAPELPESSRLPTLKEYRRHCERRYLEQVLQRTGFNVSAAARLLGISRAHLHEKMSDLGISRG